MKRWLKITITTIILINISLILHSQDETTPSKTPTEIASNLQSDANTQVNSQEPRYTQEDLTTLIGNVQRPNGFAWLNNTLYTICNGDWTLYSIDDTTGATETFLFGIRNGHTLHAEETEAGFNLWIPDSDLNTLFLVDQSRTAARPILENIDSPWGITVLDESRFLLTSLRENKVLAVTRDGQSLDIVEDLSSPTGIVSVNEGEFVYVANTGSSRRSIEWFSMDNPETQPLVSGLRNVTGVVLAEDQNLYFAYSLGTRGVIGRVNPEECRDGGCTAEDVEIVLFSDLPAPLAGLSISPDMRLFIHTIYRPEIYWVQIED